MEMSPAVIETACQSRAIVVGAGIAGLSAAIGLRRAGWDVTVLERSRFKNEIGAAISVPPNATMVLDQWGFDVEVRFESPIGSRKSERELEGREVDNADMAAEGQRCSQCRPPHVQCLDTQDLLL